MKKLIIPVLLIILFPAALHSQMFSLWGNEHMNSCAVYTSCDTATLYSIYVFVEPGPTGVYATEYKIPEIPGHFLVSVDNPLVSLDWGNYYGSPGIAIALSSCQNDIFVICRMDMIAELPRTRDYITIEPNDDSGNLSVFECPGERRELSAIVYNYLGINQSCIGYSVAPWLERVEAILRDRVLADFDYGPWIFDDTPYHFDEHFIVYTLDEPRDTIRVIDGEWIDTNIYYPAYLDSCLLTLERSMLGGRQYELRASNICLGGNDYRPVRCDDSRMEFICPLISTQLQQFTSSTAASTVTLEWSLSSIDPGTVFHVSRCESGDLFSAIGEVAGIDDELSYRFEDRSISGGISYIYRVEYVSDAGRGVLFESETIETSPIPVILSQNHPNPFNPVTTIEYYIPDTGQISLHVYNVSGRLVRTLMDETKESGTHSITWDGLDETGNAVPSGVYFTRLSAGKTRLSRKMILLR